MSSREEEIWAMAVPTTVNDANGLIAYFGMSWETLATFEADDDLYDDYEGSSAALRQDLTTTAATSTGEHTRFNAAALTSDWPSTGVAPFRITSVDPSFSSITSGFSVAYEFYHGLPSRDWFDNVVVMTHHRKDYQAHPSEGTSAEALQLLFDRSSDSHSSFGSAFSNLVDTYVKDIHGSLGDLRETSVTHKRSPKRVISLKDTSTFDLDKFEQTGATLTTSTITATLSTGEY